MPKNKNQHDDLCGITITLLGDPVGQPRPRFVGGRVVGATGKAKRYRTALERAARQAVENLGGPEAVREAFARHGLSVSILATFGTRHVQRHGQPHTHKPDGDNIAKMIDQLVRAGALGGDDSRVADTTIRKVWGRQGSLSVTVRPINTTSPAPARRTLEEPPGWLV